MPRIVVRGPRAFERAFAAIRSELDVPPRFSDEVLAEAERARGDEAARAAGGGGRRAERRDARDLDLVAIDPPGATDLDQAFTARRRGDGFRVSYAIADVGAFVIPGGAIDTEARRRGATLYSPDTRTPLHPPVISEDRASLLAGTDKPALLWTIDLDGDGEPIDSHLERATVRVREAIAYHEAQRRITAGPNGRPDNTAGPNGRPDNTAGPNGRPDNTAGPNGRPDNTAGPNGRPVTSADPRLDLLAEIGRLRQQREADRGGVSLALPAQEIVEQDGSYALAFDDQLPVEGWNAQISLLTGIVGGRTMFDAGVGILRTLPPVDGDDVRELRGVARALDIGWPDDVPYSSFVRGLQPDSAARNAFLLQAARTFRGAGYVGFDGHRPEHPEHGAIASVYAHITAPLRRLVDRFGNEILLALHADLRPPTWACEALEELPALMGRARQRESTLERAMLDVAEVLILDGRRGEVFDATVIDIDERRDRARVQIADPAVVETVPAGGCHLGERVRLRLESVDPERREVVFAVV